MTDSDDRSWAEKRIDARRNAAGLPSKANPVLNRLITGALALIVGGLLVAKSSGVGVAIGIVLLVVAAYQLITAAIAQGTREGRVERRDES
jgi:hypothetical protein